MKRSCFTVIGWLIIGLLLMASAPTTQPADIDALITRLSNDDWKTRQSAQRQLVEMGPSVVPRLKTALDGAVDAELRIALGNTIAQIAENDLRGSSLITMHLDNVAAPVAFQRLASAARTRFNVMPPDLWKSAQSRNVSLHVDRQPFWMVLRDLCSRSGLNAEPVDEGAYVRLSEGSDTLFDGIVSSGGPVLFVAESINRATAVQLTQPPQTANEFQLHMRVLVEPKLQALQPMGPSSIQLTKAVDNNNNSLLVPIEPDNPPPPVEEESTVYSGWISDRRIPLQYPQHPGTRVQQIQGTIMMLVQTASQHHEIADPAKAIKVEQNAAGVRFAINDLIERAAKYELHLTLFKDNLENHRWRMMCRPERYVQLLDGSGHPFILSRATINPETTPELRSVTLTFTADPEQSKSPAAAKLVMEIPAEVKAITVPFEFNDLPMP